MKQVRKHRAGYLRTILFSLIALLSFFAPGHTAQAADPASSRAITVLSTNNSLGAVWAKKNGQDFLSYTYAEDTDAITVTALPVNKEYDFLHWKDNGSIVSEDSSYTFTVKGKDHVLVAVFESKPEFKRKRYKEGKRIEGIVRSADPCNYADGYKQYGLTPYTTLISIDEGTKSLLETYSGGTLAYAFRILFTPGDSSEPKELLEQPARLVITLPEREADAARAYQVVTLLSGKAPVFSADLDSVPGSVTFEAPGSGCYLLLEMPAEPVQALQ